MPRTDDIAPGFYRFRKVRGGAWVAAEVTLDATRQMIGIAENGAGVLLEVSVAHYADLVTEQIADGAAFAHPLLRVLWFGEPISEREHAYLVRLHRWAQQHDQRHPAADPGKPIDLGSLPIDLIV